MNPARTLDELFRKWRGDNSFDALRYPRDRESVSRGIKELNQAARCLQELEYYFSLMESQGRDVKRYRNKIPGYFSALISMANGNGLDQRYTDTLPFLADVIDSLTGDALALQTHLEKESDSLSEQLSDLIQAFLDDETLDQTLKNHAVMLCKHIKENIENAEAAGYFDFTESVRLLRIYVDAAAERSSDSKFKEAFRKFNEEFLKHPLAPYIVTGAAGFFGLKELGQ